MKIFNKFLDLVYSIYFNFRYLPFKQARKLPIKINHKIKVKITATSKLLLHNCNATFVVELGFKGTPFISDNCASSLTLRNSTFEIRGPITIAQGMNFFLENGCLIIGANSYINKNLCPMYWKNRNRRGFLIGLECKYKGYGWSFNNQ